MNLDIGLLDQVRAASEVRPGNVYPAKGGRKTPGTEYWLVVATSANGAHCLGFDAQGQPVSATTYLKGALRERPLLGRVDIGSVHLRSAK